MCVYEYTHTHTHTHITKVVAALLAENSEAALRRKDPTKAFAKTFKNPATAFSTTSAALTSALCGGTRIHAHIYIYIYIEREREREGDRHIYMIEGGS